MPAATSASITIRVLAGELNESPANRGLTNAVASSLRTLEPPGPNSPRMLITSGPEGMTIRCTFAPEQLDIALARVCSVLREPNIDAEAFQRAKVSTLNRARQTDLGVGLGPVFSAMRLSSDARLAPPTPESVDAWTLDAVRDWAKHILRIGPIELAIAGNIQLADAQTHLKSNLAGLKSASLISPKTWAELRVAPRDMPAGVIRVSSSTAAGNIHLVLHGPDAGDLAAVRSASVVAALLKPRLTASLTKPGATPPTLGISLVPSRAFKGLGMMMVTTRQAKPPDAAPVEPAGPGVIDPAVSPLFAAINSAIADAQRGQFPSDAQLADAIATATRESRAQLQDPEYWSRVLSISTFQGLDADELARALEDYQAITLTRAREAIIAIGDPAKGRCVVIVPLPPATPPPAAPVTP